MTQEELRKALQEVLDLYGIQLEDFPEESEEERIERAGDYSEIISKTQEKLDELNEKAEEIFQRTGMTREQLEVYASNPNNFSSEQWEALQKVKEACEKYKREAISRVNDTNFEKKVEKQKQKKKKQPHRFAKKKHWIPL